MNNNLTQTHISFLSTINKNFDVDKSEKYYYFNLYSLKIEKISQFIIGIKDNDILLVFPFITTTRRADNAYLRLSDQFLVTNKSNPELIHKFLESQWNNCGFEIVESEQGWLYFKYKKVFISEIDFK
jgi:hypothetical protein